MIAASVGTSPVSESWPNWSDFILVNASAATEPIYVATDGSTASTSNFTDIIPAGKVMNVANRQPKLDMLQFAGKGGLDDARNPAGNGETAQSVPASLWPSGAPTLISMISTSANQAVGLEQR